MAKEQGGCDNCRAWLSFCTNIFAINDGKTYEQSIRVADIAAAQSRIAAIVVEATIDLPALP